MDDFLSRLRGLAGQYSTHHGSADLIRQAADRIEQTDAARRAFLEQAVCHPGPPLSEHEGYDLDADLSDLEGSVLERMDMETRFHRELMEIRREAEDILARTPDPSRSTLQVFKDLLAHFIAFHQHLEERVTAANEQVASIKRAALDALNGPEVRARLAEARARVLELNLAESQKSALEALAKQQVKYGARLEALRALALQAVNHEHPNLNAERRVWRATGFTRSELKRRRAVLQRRLGHLEQRVGERIDERPYDAAEVSALKTSLVLFDEALGLVHSAAAAQAMGPVAVDNGQRDAVAEHIRAAGGDPAAATVAQIADALNATSGGLTFTPNEAGDGVNWEIDQKAIASTIEIVGGDQVADLGLAGFDGFIARHKGALNSPETRRRIAEGLAGLLASAAKPSPKVVCVSTEAELLRGEARFEVRGLAAPNPTGNSYEEACEDWARSLAAEFSCDFVTARQVVALVGAERARDVLGEAYATNVHPVTVANRVAAKPAP